METISLFGMNAPVLAEILIGSVMKVSLVLLLALLAASIARRTTFATKHFILTLALAGALLIPVGSAVWMALAPSALPHVNTSAVILPAVTTVSPGAAGATSSFSVQSWWSLGLIVWLAGVLLFVLREIAGHVRVHRMLRRADVIADANLQQLFAQCTATLGITRPVRLLIHPDQPVPFTCGLFRPVVVLTGRELDSSPDQLRRILLHELAHIARLDIAANTIARWATALFWFNPLVWLANSRLHQEQERACDDHVVHTGESAAEYAELLLDYARHLRRHFALLPEGITFVRMQSLRARIQSLLDPRPRNRRVRSATLTVLAAVALSSVLLLSCVRTPTAENNANAAAKADDETVPPPDVFIEVDEMPVMTKEETPVYPENLAEQEITGDVWVRALIGTDGKVREAHPVNPNKYEEFNTAAIDAALKNEFTPAQKNGKPVAIWVTYKVSFRLPGVEGKGDDC